MTNSTDKLDPLRRTWRTSFAFVAAILLSFPYVGVPARAFAASSPATLTYEPNRNIHSFYSALELDRFLSQLDHYGIQQALLQTPRFDDSGIVSVPAIDLIMFAAWVMQAKTYNAAHGTDITVTAIFNGEVKTTGTGVDLDDPITRANMVAGIESVLATGVSAVHLDLEPFVVTPGFLALLDEINAAFDRIGLGRNLSVAAPGQVWKWSADYLNQVSQRITQINPLYYDSGFAEVSTYKNWIVRSLHFYTANVVATTKIVPVIPSYSSNPWHRPNVENIDTATSALAVALATGSRVNGAGIWWWYGFFYNEDGGYDASGDRATWRSRTIILPFSP